MKYRVNPDGSRSVVATPEEVHKLRPCIVAALRRHKCPEQDIEDLAQNVEIITWQALNEGQIQCDRLTSPRDALFSFVTQTSWYVWKNHSRRPQDRYEILTDEPPERIGSCPVACLETRDALRRILAEPRVSHILLLSLNGSRPERHVDMPRATFWHRVAVARQWARDVAKWQEPRQPTPPTPKHRKGKR